MVLFFVMGVPQQHRGFKTNKNTNKEINHRETTRKEDYKQTKTIQYANNKQKTQLKQKHCAATNIKTTNIKNIDKTKRSSQKREAKKRFGSQIQVGSLAIAILSIVSPGQT